MNDQNALIRPSRHGEANALLHAASGSGALGGGHTFANNLISGDGYTQFGDTYNINIDSRPRTLPSSLWTVTRPTNRLFTGRDDILDELETTSRDAVNNQSRREPCNIVITGIGGQGKSEICLQLANRLRPLFWGVFWVDVSTVALAENGYRDIANLLHVEASAWEAGRQALANISEPWLLILDNADDHKTDYQQYFPSGSWGVRILTSRNANCKCYATRKWIDLEGLSEAEAVELLFRAAGTVVKERQAVQVDARACALRLQSHPLALVQAGAYVASDYCSMKEYPRVYEQQRQRLLTFRPKQGNSRYRDVYATFEASAQALQSACSNAGTDALQLLSILAMYEASRLPLMLLFETAWTEAQHVLDEEVNDGDVEIIDLTRRTRWHVERLPSLVGVGTKQWDSFRLLEAVNLLKTFSLIFIDTEEDKLYVSMHALVHAWARDRLDMNEQQPHWLQSACIVAVSYSHDFWDMHLRLMQPHLQALTSNEMVDMFASEPMLQVCCILFACGWLLEFMSANGSLSAFVSRWMAHMCLDPLVVEPRWLCIYRLFAQSLATCGQTTAAVSLLEQLFNICRDELDISDPKRLQVQYDLACVYRDTGQDKEAISLLESLVEVEARKLPVDHNDRLLTQHALAVTYMDRGQIQKVLTLLEHVDKIEAQKLPEDHYHGLMTRSNLAKCYWMTECREIALEMTREVVSVLQRVLDEDHPSRKHSEEWLDYMEAEYGAS